jgi:hypothetical protein
MEPSFWAVLDWLVAPKQPAAPKNGKTTNGAMTIDAVIHRFLRCLTRVRLAHHAEASTTRRDHAYSGLMVPPKLALCVVLLVVAAGCSGKAAPSTGSGQPASTASGSESGDGSPTDHPVITLAVLQAGPREIAVDDTRVYWLNVGNKTVISCPIANCKPPLTVLADFQPSLTSLVLHAGTLYWGTAAGTIQTCASTGCGDHPTTFLGPLREVTGPAAADSQNLYITTGYGIGACALGGCNGQEKALAYAIAEPSVPTLAAGVMYWVDREGFRYPIESCPVAGCNQQPTTLVTQAAAPSAVFSLAADATRIYWSNEQGVWTCPNTGCTTPTLMFLQISVARILVDANNVYACLAEAITKCAVGGCNGQPSRLASFHGGCVGLAQDARALYWTTLDGTVLTTTK